MRKNSEEVNGQVRRNMFTLTEGLQRKAIERYADHYRRRVKDVHPAVLGDYSSNVDFYNRDGERQKITTYYEKVRDDQLSQIKLITAIVGAIVCVGGIGLAIYTMSPACLVITATGAALIVYNLISNNMQKKHIQETCLLNINNKNGIMDDLFAEYALYKRELAEYDAYYDRVIDALEQF